MASQSTRRHVDRIRSTLGERFPASSAASRPAVALNRQIHHLFRFSDSLPTGAAPIQPCLKLSGEQRLA
jgi:hypothetical protein